ncbi:hypothetical protein HELRODRAFT_176805 [Helobdella robusta]|uniref:TFIIS N-terminal domain-containing protein n=1 Tax=Helobdella robusta TaxID=6412 RepID=T1FAX6_HELRO|nr:hypothetical protein HELRODRAFT_176805 [Helobdella robusta]ESN99635.1 hypothetical protein HELRODRAFT_176805 [Helobdella robusta]
MDKFVIRGGKLPISLPEGGTKIKMKQVTIQSLKGVVNIDEILKIKTIIKENNQSDEILRGCLETLKEKLPSRDVLKSTKIGYAVKSLTNHKDQKISSLASEILKSWQQFYAEKLSKPLIDVKCDHKTMFSRNIARKHLTNALKSDSAEMEVFAVDVATEIETSVFQKKKFINKEYNRLIRKIVFLLRNNNSLKVDLLKHSILPHQLIDRYET